MPGYLDTVLLPLSMYFIKNEITQEYKLHE